MGEVAVGHLDGGEVVEEGVEGCLLGGDLFWGGFGCWGGTRAVDKKAAAQSRNELDGQNLWAGQVSGGITGWAVCGYKKRGSQIEDAQQHGGGVWRVLEAAGWRWWA